MKRVINFGKIDYNNNGRRDNAAKIIIEYRTIKEGKKELSICGEVWNRLGTDIISGGQNLDDMLPFFKDNEEFKTIYRLWKLYHLNGTRPECEHQRANGWNKTALVEVVTNKQAKKTLGWTTQEEHPDGILSRPCEVCGYKYGTAWKHHQIPEEDEKIILQFFKEN